MHGVKVYVTPGTKGACGHRRNKRREAITADPSFRRDDGGSAIVRSPAAHSAPLSGFLKISNTDR